MKRQKKKYSRPQKPFDKIRIVEENILKERYGLKTKKEIWKADASIKRIRNLAKKLITGSEEEKSAFVQRLSKKGFAVKDIAESLTLDKESWLKRRLQTIVHAKKLTNTPKQARQLIVHKHVSIGNQIINIPSYQVALDEEAEVKLDLVINAIKEKVSKIEKIKEEVIKEGIKSKENDGAKENDKDKSEVEEIKDVSNEVESNHNSSKTNLDPKNKDNIAESKEPIKSENKMINPEITN